MQTINLATLTQSFAADNAALIQFNKLFNKSDKIRFLTKFGVSILKDNNDTNKSLIKAFVCATLNEMPSNVSHAFLAEYRNTHGIESPNVTTRLNDGTTSTTVKRVSYKRAIVIPIDVVYTAPTYPTLKELDEDLISMGITQQMIDATNAAKIAAYETAKTSSVETYAAQIRAALTEETLMALIMDYAAKVVNPTAVQQSDETSNDGSNDDTMSNDDTANDTQSDDDDKPF